MAEAPLRHYLDFVHGVDQAIGRPRLDVADDACTKPRQGAGGCIVALLTLTHRHHKNSPWPRGHKTDSNHTLENNVLERNNPSANRQTRHY